MPIYEYRCGTCGLVFEEIMSAATTENPPCPQCGSKDTEKQLSTFSGRTLSGSGEMLQMPAGGCGSSGFS